MPVAIPTTYIRCGNCWRKLAFRGEYEEARISAQNLGWGFARNSQWSCPACLTKQDCQHVWRDPTDEDRKRRPWIPRAHSSMYGTAGVHICAECFALDSYDTGD